MMNRTNQKHKRCLLGAHFSIAKGLHNALLEAKAYGCNSVQLFTKNANSWKERTLTDGEIELFEKAMADTGIAHVYSHTSYLINLASPEQKKHAMSCCALEQELLRSSQLRIPYIVLHPGSHMGHGETAGIRQIAESVSTIFLKHPKIKTRLLFETTAGQGTSIGHAFEQLAAIIKRVKPQSKVGICLDSSHIFAAGYDIRTQMSYQETLGKLDDIIGLQHLCLIHLNDSKKDLGSRVDRHEHIGEGKLNIRAFEYMMNDTRLAEIPKIIETPKHKDDQDGDRINLKRLRSIYRTSDSD
ncbi:deoxyribonuclease IV [Thermodesulfobacteriota bacterium]